jgi:hypothetical protein
VESEPAFLEESRGATKDAGCWMLDALSHRHQKKFCRQPIAFSEMIDYAIINPFAGIDRLLQHGGFNYLLHPTMTRKAKWL